MVYDPELDFVYFGTGNASPWYDRLRARAMISTSLPSSRSEPTTANRSWHYQTTPGDNWDYDATQPLMLATLTIDGQQRRVVMQRTKTDFFYVLDREKGALISAHLLPPINWATGIDSSGGP